MAETASAALIPNHYHFVFGLRPQTEPFHLIFYLCLESCLRVNQPEAISLYYQHEPYGRYWDLIKERVTLVPVEPVPLVERHRYRDRRVRPYRYAHHADFIRLDKVVAHGGIYADMDTLFVRRPSAALRAWPFVLGREADVPDPVTGQRQASVCNAVIMAQPGAAFGVRWLAEMERAFDGTWSQHSTLLPERLSREHPDLIHIEPSDTFYKYMWTPEGLRALLEECHPDDEVVVSLHLWAHLWWQRWRRDFSPVHAGQITEEYIRTVDTTYTRAARPFLPPPAATRRRFEWRAPWTKRGQP